MFLVKKIGRYWPIYMESLIIEKMIDRWKMFECFLVEHESLFNIS